MGGERVRQVGGRRSKGESERRGRAWQEECNSSESVFRGDSRTALHGAYAAL